MENLKTTKLYDCLLPFEVKLLKEKDVRNVYLIDLTVHELIIICDVLKINRYSFLQLDFIINRKILV
jgi:hypothetical protein